MPPKSEQPPCGTSAHAGQFTTAAFAGTFFPEQGHRNQVFKTRFNHRVGEHRGLMYADHAAQHAAHVEFATTKEAIRPSRLRQSYNEHFEVNRMAKSTGFLPSRSTPDLQQEAQPSAPSQPTLRPATSAAELSRPAASPPMNQSRRMAATSQSMRSTSSMSSARSSVDEEDATEKMFRASRSMNQRYFPHICANRGELKLTKPAAMLQGIDPAKDKAHPDLLFEAPKHRFADVKSLPGGEPSLPMRSLKWSSDLAWNDPANHAATKVTQTVGGRNANASAVFGSLVGPRTMATVAKKERLLMSQ